MTIIKDGKYLQIVWGNGHLLVTIPLRVNIQFNELIHMGIHSQMNDQTMS